MTSNLGEVKIDATYIEAKKISRLIVKDNCKDSASIKSNGVRKAANDRNAPIRVKDLPTSSEVWRVIDVIKTSNCPNPNPSSNAEKMKYADELDMPINKTPTA